MDEGFIKAAMELMVRDVFASLKYLMLNKGLFCNTSPVTPGCIKCKTYK